MSPSAPPPSPQEIQRKLSVHSVSRVKSNLSGGPVSGTESDSDSNYAPDTLTSTSHINTGVHGGASSSNPPLSSIAERRSGSGEDSEDEDEVEGGWKMADVKGKPRNSTDAGVIKSGYLWKKGERRKTWKKRWFVLRAAHLAYYKTAAEYQLLRLLELSDVHSCTQVFLKRHENAFGLISPVRTFYLQASSPREVQEWVSAIEDARQALMASSTQTSMSTPIPIPKPKSHHPSPLSPSSPAHSPQVQIVTSSDSEDDRFGSVATSKSPVNAPYSPSSSKSPTSPREPSKVVLSGYLMKCGSKRRNWRKRWFVLTAEKLLYSGSHMDTKPHRQFSVIQILDALEYELPARHHHHYTQTSPSVPSPPNVPSISDADDVHGAHTFKIVTTKRTLLLCAPSEEDEIKWLGAVRALIARRTGSGVVPGELKAAQSSAHAVDSSVSTTGGNVGIKGKVRRLSVGGTSARSGNAIPEEVRE